MTSRLDRLEPFVVEPELFQTADFEVLDHDVRMGRELAHQRAPRLGRIIRRDAALAAIATVEIRGRDVVAVGVVDVRWPPVTRVVALPRALDLHDVRAEIGEKLPGPGTGKNARQFKNFYAGERRGSHVEKPERRSICRILGCDAPTVSGDDF